MEPEIYNLINKNKNIKFFKYKEFKLNNPLNMKTKTNQKMIFNLNKLPNTEAYYNNRTFYCDILGIIDINNKRYYEFDDDSWSMTNKGLDILTTSTFI